MDNWKMYIPWRKLQSLALILATISLVFLLLQVLGLKIVATNDGYASRFLRTHSERRENSTGTTRRQKHVETCTVVSENGNTNWCEEIKPFNAKPDVISTFDLPEETDFSTDATGRYVFPDEFYEPDSNNNGIVDVILVPFTHVDPGYGQTMEDYYKIYVRSILDLVLEKLDKYRALTFQWTETVFLERWFREIDERKKQQFREIVARGQLEIVLGGWVMPDEALTDYKTIIDQLMEGHLWVKDSLGVQPTNAWINDPSGYSGTFPYLLKRSGINNVVLLRIHQAIKNTLQHKKALEFFWQPYWTSSREKGLFCNVMPFEGYNAVCGPEQAICSQFDYMQTHARGSRAVLISDTNVHRLALQLHNQYRFTAGLFNYQTLIIFIGGTNGFNVGKSWEDTYENYVKLIAHINAIPDFNMNIQFGTLKDYFATLEKKQKLYADDETLLFQPTSFATVHGDFFPYSDKNNYYWTGFYSNRPWMRKFSRFAEAVLRAADIFSVIGYKKISSADNGLFQSVLSKLRSARRNISLCQHHDAVAGTSFPHVVRDFEKRAVDAYRNALGGLKISVATMLSGSFTHSNDLFETVEITNARTPPTVAVLNTNHGATALILVNSLLRKRTEVVSVSVTKPRVRLRDSDGRELTHQVSQDVKMKNLFLISFEVSLKPFEIKRVTLESMPNENDNIEANLKYAITGDEVLRLENSYMEVTINSTTGSLIEICERGNGHKCTRVASSLLEYKSKKSGAYVFGPAGKARSVSHLWLVPDMYIFKGPLVSEVIFRHQEGFTQQFRLYNVKGPKGQGLHVSNKIQLPEKKIMNNTELILRLKTDIKNGDIFFTDDNGFQLMGRQNSKTRPLESNYYPMTRMVVLEDEIKRLTLHSAQSLGVASLEEGWVEVMLDRAVDRDDGKGLGMGVGDRVLTVTDFVIQIEHKSVPGPVAEPRYTYPTVNSILLNEQLQNNIISFSYERHTDTNDYEVPDSDIPCDLSVAGLKTLTNGFGITTGTSVIIHRPALHCQFLATDLTCSTQGSYNVKQFLEVMGIYEKGIEVEIEETSLTHLQKLRPMTVCDNILPEKNELKALVIRHESG